MLREGSGIEDGGSPTRDDTTRPDWRAVDRALRDIARRRSKLDATSAQARDALVGLGWKPALARAAVDHGPTWNRPPPSRC